MLAAADTQRRSENIGVDLLIDRAGARLKRALLALGILTVAISALLMTVKGYEMVEFAHMLGLRSNTLGWAAMWPVQALVPVGAALLLVVSLAQLLVLAAGGAPVPERTDEVPKGLE
jgi:TRAP-type C4-dicarboxylate transport system permease small subunit